MDAVHLRQERPYRIDRFGQCAYRSARSLCTGLQAKRPDFIILWRTAPNSGKSGVILWLDLSQMDIRSAAPHNTRPRLGCRIVACFV